MLERTQLSVVKENSKILLEEGRSRQHSIYNEYFTNPLQTRKINDQATKTKKKNKSRTPEARSKNCEALQKRTEEYESSMDLKNNQTVKLQASKSLQFKSIHRMNLLESVSSSEK